MAREYCCPWDEETCRYGALHNGLLRALHQWAGENGMNAPRKKVTAGITMRSDCAMHAAIEGRLHVHQ